MTVPANTTFIPIAVSGRVDDTLAATNGQYWAVGFNGANRRVDYGVCATAAAAGTHTANAKLRWLNSSELVNQVLAGGEMMSVISTLATADNAGLGANMGGAAGDGFTIVYSGWMIRDLPNL